MDLLTARHETLHGPWPSSKASRRRLVQWWEMCTELRGLLTAQNCSS